MKPAALALLLGLAMAGCAREDPLARADTAQLRSKVNGLEERVRVLELSRQAATERPVTLTRTWLMSSQPPSTSQTTYSSAAACEAARKSALEDADKLIAERRKEALAEKAERGVGIVVNADLPSLQASCSS